MLRIKSQEFDTSTVNLFVRMLSVSMVEDPLHAIKVGKYTQLLSELYGYSPRDSREIGLAATLHDVGKLVCNPLILMKPAKLRSEEFNIVKNHTLDGHMLLSNLGSPFLDKAALIALTHHMTFAGDNGYPEMLGVSVDKTLGYLTSVCDIYEALSSRRCYKDRWNFEDVLEHISGLGGNKLQPDMVKLFVANSKKFIELEGELKSEGDMEW